MTSSLPPLNILHVGNIANNAYTNARLLMERGHTCHVACYDFYHFAGTTEWMDMPDGLSRETLGHDAFPNFWVLGDKRPEVPRWFAQGPQLRVLNYLHYLIRGETRLADIAWSCLRYGRFKAIMRHDTMPDRWEYTEDEFQEAIASVPLTQADKYELYTGRSFERIVEQVRMALRRVYDNYMVAHFLPPYEPDWLDLVSAWDPSLELIVKRLRATGALAAAGIEHEVRFRMPGDVPAEADPADVLPYKNVVPMWRSLFSHYDIVMLYGADPILGYLANDKPYVAYEHGTIRKIPFEDTIMGRLVNAAYRKASTVFVTNTDYVGQSERLEFEKDQLVFLPHTFDERPLRALKAQRGRHLPDIVTFFAPARHDWVQANPNMSKSNDWIVHAAAHLKAHGAPAFKVLLVEWGIDVAATKALITELALDDVFEWTSPLNKRALWEKYLDTHAVIDQFLIPSISGVSFEALALGSRIITFDDGLCNRTAFGEQPPFLAARDQASLIARMQDVLDDPADAAGIEAAAMAWVDTYHSAKRIVDLEEKAFQRILLERDTSFQSALPDLVVAG